RDIVADELLHVREAHHPAVEADPLVHSAELDVADTVIDRGEILPGRHARGLRSYVTGQVRPGVVAPLDQRVDGLARGADGGETHRAAFVLFGMRLPDRGCAVSDRVFEGAVCRRHPDSQVDHAIAVRRDVPGQVGT